MEEQLMNRRETYPCAKLEETIQIVEELVQDTDDGPVGCYFCSHTCMIMMIYELKPSTDKPMSKEIYEYTLKTCYPRKRKDNREKMLDEELDKFDSDSYS